MSVEVRVSRGSTCFRRDWNSSGMLNVVDAMVAREFLNGSLGMRGSRGLQTMSACSNSEHTLLL